jgi:hypothetical protein
MFQEIYYLTGTLDALVRVFRFKSNVVGSESLSMTIDVSVMHATADAAQTRYIDRR